MAEKTEKKQSAYWMLFASFICVLTAILAFVLLSGGKKEEVLADVKGSAMKETSERMPDDETEDLGDNPETEEKESDTEILKVKEAAGETDDITLGIDVSKFQENIDWEQVAASGVDFAMVRIGYRKSVAGEIMEDERARYNLQEAAANGIKLGAYFFSTAVDETEAEEEAKWVCELLKGYPITYPVVYNCEGFQEESSRQYGLTTEERTALARVFLDRIEENGYTGMFYAARSELQDNLFWDTDTLQQRYRIWVAQYLTELYPEVSKPEYDGFYAMWQYTDQGTVPGIKTVVDLNVAYFGYEETAAPLEEGAAQYAEADPETGVIFEETEEQVTSKDVTNLRSTMDQGDDSNVVVKLKNGELCTRTGMGDNGWSRVEYEGQVLYAVSGYLEVVE